MTRCESTKIVWSILLLLSFMQPGVPAAGFANGVEDITSDNLYHILEPYIKNGIATKHLDPCVLQDVTFDYLLLPTVFLYRGNLSGLSLFYNESVKSSWNRESRMAHMEMRLVFPELNINYQWRSVMGQGSLSYIIYNMLIDLSFTLDLQNLKLRILDARFNNMRAETEIAVRSRLVTNILNALRNQLKGLNNWVLDPVTVKMNKALGEEIKERNIDIFELLGIKHLYQPLTSTPTAMDASVNATWAL